MINTIKKILLVSRPISWINTAYPFAVAYLLAGGDDYALLALGTLFFLIPYNLLMYGVNDIFDYESDIRNPRKGGIEGMREQKNLHPAIIQAILIMNIPFVIYLFATGAVFSGLVLVIVLFFVVAYSIAKLRFKERPFLDSFTSSMHFVGPALFALALTQFNPVAMPYLIAFLLWGMASHAFGAVQDIVPDRQAKIASIATFLGARKTTLLAAGLYVAAAGILFTQPMPYTIIGLAGMLYVFNLIGMQSITDETSAIANKPWRRFIWLNMLAGFVVTIVLLFDHLKL